MARHLVAIGLLVVAIASAIGLGERAWRWNDELALVSPLAAVAPRIDDPHTPRLARRVVLVIIDGLGADPSHLAFLDELRRRGVDAVARVPYPTISRPNYVTILTGVPPRDSGVRTNRVRAPVAVDTVMDRARAAGLRVATASDFGMIATLFLRGTPSLDGVRLVEDGARVAPPAPIAWPFDDARRTASLDALGAAIAELAASDAALVAVLVLDVDRAGHAAGVGAGYRGAAAAVDRTLRGALAQVDPARDAVIVTADHGHVARGGHGGPEPEVSRVPLVLAGAGVVPGAVARDPRLIDVAPTVAALLGIPAPGHAEGRALVELLALDAAAAARRAAADAARSRAAADAVAAAHADLARPDPVRLAVVLAGLGLAAIAGRWLVPRGALAVPVPGLAAAGVAPAVLAVATVVATGGRMSPSYVPSLTTVEQLGAVAVAVAIAAQVIASRCVVRRARDRLAAAGGLALVGLGLALGATGAVRAWFSQPHLDVPPPFWMVAIPALDLAAAAGAAASAITLAIALLRRRRGGCDSRGTARDHAAATKISTQSIAAGRDDGTSPTNRTMRLRTLIVVLLGCNSSPAAQQPPSRPPPEVGIVTLRPEPVTLQTELAGRTVASLVSDVRPQISGIIKARRFEEGALVKAGQVLYEIDPAMYRAASEEARADVASAKATLEAARLKDERFAALAKIEGISKQEADDAHAAHELATTGVAQKQAALEVTRINLDYTLIKAPITGRIGKSSVTAGALVTANQPQALATIRALDPIYVDLTQSSEARLKLRAQLATAGVQAGSTRVKLKLGDGALYDRDGALEFAEVAVDEATGSVTLRATFPNPDGVLLPGMYVRAVLDQAVATTAILAPQQGISHDPKGNATALVVGAGDKIEPRTLVTDRAIGDRWLVTGGLAAGDRLIVEGLNKVGPGMPVHPVEIAAAKPDAAKPDAAKPDAAKPDAAKPDAAKPAAAPAKER